MAQVLDHVDEHVFLAARKVETFVEYHAALSISQRPDGLSVEEGRLLFSTQEVRRIHLEDLRESQELVHRGIGDMPRPYAFDLFFREVTSGHPGHILFGVRLPGSIISHDIEKPIQSLCNTAPPLVPLGPDRDSQSIEISEPQFRGKAHRLRQGS